MASSHAAHGEIRNPGPFAVSGGLRGALIVFLLIGIATFFFGVNQDPTRLWAGFILNHFFFLVLALGGIFFAALQWLTGAMWSAPVRRVSESFTAYLPIALLTFIVLCFGLSHLYAWMDPSRVASDHVLREKSSYLNATWFIIRNLIYFALWFFFTKKIVGNSIAQDRTKDIRHTLKNRFWSPIFMIVFGLTFTLMSFDLLMSLDPHWFSTMFGVYCFAGLFYANLALVCVVTLFLRGKLEGIVNDNHMHDLGKFMFAFTIFWAYIGFAQFMLIWYANLPEETSYFLQRFADGWFWVSLFLLVGKFMVPFFFLLPRDSKRSDGMLMGIGIFMLIAEWIDVLWMVQPEFFKDGPHVGIIEIGLFLGFLGAFGLAVSWFLGRNNIVAIGDPRLADAVFHHHQ